MSGTDYGDDAVADRLERVYRSGDVAAQRADTLSRLALRPGERVIDIGSGPGFLGDEMAGAVGPEGSMLGVDISAALVRRSRARNTRSWADYVEGDALALPVGDGAFDVAVSTQVAEYLPDPDRFCAECHRVLAPGGRLLVVATDWSSVVWHSDEPERMARVLRAWEGHCADPHLPRHLAPRLDRAGFRSIRASAFAMVNLSKGDDTYSGGAAALIRDWLTARNLLAPGEADAWAAELDELSASGGYFFTTSRIVFEAVKPG